VKSTNKSLLAILETDNQLLEDQVEFWSMVRELRENSRRLEVTCFFEELPLLMAGIVVSKDSATLEGYSSFSIHANHIDMVKIVSAEETGFIRLAGELMRWEELIRTASSNQQVVKVEPNTRGAISAATIRYVKGLMFHKLDSS
jgi:hypothetical protein